MAVAKRGSKSREERAPKRSTSRAEANQRRAAISALKADARRARLGAAALLGDERAAQVKVLTLLSMTWHCSLRIALDALLVCQINGARTCGELSEAERRELAAAVSQVRQGIADPPHCALPSHPEWADRELDRVLRSTRQNVPAVELAPSEFAAARTGLEVDPLLLRVVDRLVGAVRLYADRDDGGVRARTVAEQWVRYRNYIAKVARGEYPPPTQRGPAVLE